MSVNFNTWCDRATGTYEVVRWIDGKATIVQRNIRTKTKAIEARKIWEERQRLCDMEAGMDEIEVNLRRASE